MLLGSNLALTAIDWLRQVGEICSCRFLKLSGMHKIGQVIVTKTHCTHFICMDLANTCMSLLQMCPVLDTVSQNEFYFSDNLKLIGLGRFKTSFKTESFNKSYQDLQFGSLDKWWKGQLYARLFRRQGKPKTLDDCVVAETLCQLPLVFFTF